MNREDYQRVKEIFQAALDVAPESRAAYLDKVCGADEILRREVERLLEAFDSQFLERPAVAQVAEIVVKEKLENEPTEIGYADETSETEEDELPPAPNENALRPSRLRFVIVCLLFAVLFIFVGINISQSFLIQSSPPFDYALQGGGIVITNVRQGFEEAFEAEKADERSDLFAVGVMIYECLHGEKPFTGKTYQELIRSMSRRIVFDSAFAKLFRSGLAQKSENRFATASEIKKSLTDQNPA
ncbi:MAG: hypothetical protein M3Q99_11690 [Acidobacteriota bacterium]|nr:hypothetical protein [Acidobacteriota bacterium]